jgi:hypothetical protein
LAGEWIQGGIQGELLQLRLGSQQTIEGVAVRQGKTARLHAMAPAHRQGLKTLLLQERPASLKRLVAISQAEAALMNTG